MNEENKMLVRRLYSECLNAGDLSLLPDLLAETFVGGRGERGPAEYARTIERLRSGFPDARFVIEDMVAEGDRVAGGIAGGSPSSVASCGVGCQEEKFYLIDPNGGSLVVRADGGQGGSGGRGGRGGRGGSGGIGSPNGTNGMNGMDGRSGFDGQSGWGGEITVIYDPRAKPYLKTIQLSSAGGPAPMFREESVPPLW